MTNKIVKLICAAATLLLFSGCSYTGKVVPNLDTELITDKKIPSTLALDGRKLAGGKTTALPGAVTLTVEHGDALLESIEHQMKNLYDNVYVISKPSDIKAYDILMSVSNRVDSLCGGARCTLSSKTSFTLKDSKLNTLLTDRIVDDFVWDQPGSATALGITMGATLLVTAPILAPIALDLEGEELKRQVSASNNRVAALITEAVINSKATGKTRKSTKSMVTIKSPLDDVLDGVVVVRGKSGTGSGFFVNGSGFIVTNAHVVADDNEVDIELRDGTSSTGVIVDKDKQADLALVKTDIKGTHRLNLGKLSTSGIGTSVISVGTPKGLEWSVSKGIVSAFREHDGITYVQTDAAVNSGNSGGPLLNLDSKEVIGVITFALKGATIEGLNFAVGVEQIQKSFPYISTYK